MVLLKGSSFTDIFPIGHIRCCFAHPDDLVLTLLEHERGIADLCRNFPDIIRVLVKNGDDNLEFC
jgi:hypothetical protein